MGFVLVAVFALWSGSRSKESGKGKVAPSGEFDGEWKQEQSKQKREGYSKWEIYW